MIYYSLSQLRGINRVVTGLCMTSVKTPWLMKGAQIELRLGNCWADADECLAYMKSEDHDS